MEVRWNQQDLLVNLAGVILGNGVSILGNWVDGGL